MKDYLKAYAAIFAALALIAASLTVVIISQPAQAREIEPEWTWRIAPSDKVNTGAALRLKMDAIGERVQAVIAEYEAEQAAEQAALEVEQYYEPYYYEPTYYAPSYSVPSDGLTAQSGVNYHDGRTETYYSSNVLYHYNTAAWTVDDEGFYRTDEGYYVVAASDMEQGTVFEGSKGECIVLDSGCAEGVTDYYVNWR